MRIADRIVLMQAGPHRAGRHGRGDLPPPGRHLRGALLLRLHRGRGRRPRRAGRDAGRALCRRRRWRTARAAVVCIRPQGVRLKPAGFCLPGRLLSRRFLGEVELVQVAVQGLDHPLQARVRGPVLVNAGEDVGVEIDPDEVLVFAAGHP